MSLSDNKSNGKIILIAYYIMIFVTIFNKNKYHASISFILYPVLLSFFICMFASNLLKERFHTYIITLIICIVTIGSTVCSDVVEWGAVANSFIIFAFLYFFMTSRQFDADDIRKILKFYGYITVFLSILLLINIILSNNMVDGRVSLTILGARKDENYLSSYLVFGYYFFVSSFFWGSKKKVYMLFAVIVFGVVFMTGSRGALVAMLAASMFLIMKVVFSNGFSAKSFVITIGMVIFVGVIYIFLSNTSLFSRMSNVDGYTDNIRLVIWGYAMEGFYRRPWFGSGIQSGTYFSQLHVRWFTHSCYVDLITSIGIIGALLFVIQYAQFIMVKKGNYFFMIGMLLILFVPLMFINGFETATFWMPMVLCKITSDYCKTNNFAELLA